MTMIADNLGHSMFRQVKADLRYFPGRFAMAWRIGALTALMSFVAMFYGIPESAISCYLILFIMKPDAVTSMIMAVAIIILVTIVVGLIILILPMTLEYGPLRMTILIASSFFFLWLGSASQLGEVGSIIALVIAFIMGLIGFAPTGEIATRAILYAWLMTASPMLLLFIFNYLFGRSPVMLVYESLTERLQIAAAALRDPDVTQIRQVRLQLLDDQNDLAQRAMFVKVFHLGRGAENKWLPAAVINSYRVLMAVSELAETLPEPIRLKMADWCSSAAQQLAVKRMPALPEWSSQELNNEIADALIAFATPDDKPLPAGIKTPFFAPDALTNPVHRYFALKTTLASVICYLTYTLLDWQSIHTAMITCYVAVLGTTGETVHKLVLRITGCLIGATMGMLSLIFIVPGMDDIGQLMILVFIALLLSAWISTGNERIAYAGIQVGLAFLLTVLHGFAPSDDLDVATGRILGILLGNVVIYVIFTHLWPVGIVDSVRSSIRNNLKDLSILSELPLQARMQVTLQAARIEQSIARTIESLRLVPFEPKNLRPSTEEYQRLTKILLEIDVTCRALFLPMARDEADKERLKALCISQSVSLEKNENTGVVDAEFPPEPLVVQDALKRSLTRLEGLLK
ncbi:FUSC family protein [uncultured Cedecea sp.]|uniref:FUSC family protein n=1 Tax=uncultured Cedecea sp. TaxID=988762 RepID=UPI0026336DF8|nr:FUSC family protein [uncultured Cedecea sp.]